MNVLVYNGNGATLSSVKHAIETLRFFLEPYYAVSVISAKGLQTEPWASKTAAIVFPGGADLPYVKECKTVIPAIRDYIKRGGIYIGFCAGGYFASGRCEFAQGDPVLEVTGNRDLALFKGIARGPAYNGFQYDSEAGSRAVNLQVSNGNNFFTYYNGGAVFVDADKYKDVEVLAKYTNPVEVVGPDGTVSTSSNAAVVLCSHGKGKALLTGPHPEFIPRHLEKSKNEAFVKSVVEVLKKNEQQRLEFMNFILSSTGLKCNQNYLTLSVPKLTPLLLSTQDSQKQMLQKFTSNLATLSQKNCLESETKHSIQIFGGHDTINIYNGFEKSYEGAKHFTESLELDDEVKTLIIPDSNELIAPLGMTPNFDIRKYMYHLQTKSLGQLCLSGEVVTSTSTFLNDNRNFLAAIPDNSMVHVGSIQVSGRGRGGNVWVNPHGVSASTVVINLPTVSPTSQKPVSIVFVQYLAMLAYCKAISTYSHGYEDLPVKIKWPNDLYVLNPAYYSDKKICLLKKGLTKNLAPLSGIEPAYVKIGGSLINTNFIDNKYSLLIGCGLNVKSEGPTTSIKKWVDLINLERKNNNMPMLEEIEIETLLGKYITILENLLEKYVDYGPQVLLAEYYSYWLHSDQIVTLSEHGNAKAMLTGITEDYGLLIAKELKAGSTTEFTGVTYHLQPDGNTFDIFKGMISKKITN